MIDENNRNYVMKVNLDGVDLDDAKFNTDFKKTQEKFDKCTFRPYDLGEITEV